MEIERFIDYLNHGASISLVAQRRIGKTSLMQEVGRLIADRYVVLQVDLQKCESPEDAIAELSIAVKPHESLWRRTQGVFGNILDKVAERIGSIEKDDVKFAIRSGLNAGKTQGVSDGFRFHETQSRSGKRRRLRIPIKMNPPS